MTKSIVKHVSIKFENNFKNYLIINKKYFRFIVEEANNWNEM